MLKILSHKGRNKAVTPRMLFASTSSKKISWRVGPLCCRLHCFIISVAFRSFDSKMFLWGCPSRLFSVIQSVLTVLGLSPRLSLVYKGNHNKRNGENCPIWAMMGAEQGGWTWGVHRTYRLYILQKWRTQDGNLFFFKSKRQKQSTCTVKQV